MKRTLITTLSSYPRVTRQDRVSMFLQNFLDITSLLRVFRPLHNIVRTLQRIILIG